MALNGFIYDERDNRARDWGNVFRSLFPDGILTGCTVSFTNNTITIGAGYFMSGGRGVQVDGNTTTDIAISIQNGYVRLIYTTDLTQPASSTTFTQGALSYDFSATNTFPELVQEDINGAGTTYQTAMCIAQITGGNIVGIISTLPPVPVPLYTGGGTIDGNLTIGGTLTVGGAPLSYYDFLGAAQTITENSNLNNYLTPGVYRSPNANVTATLSNCPFSGGGLRLTVEYIANNQYIRQRLEGNSGELLTYERYIYTAGGTYGTWKLMSMSRRQVLWSGDGWTTGQINAPGISDYSVVLVQVQQAAEYIFASIVGGYLRGIGGAWINDGMYTIQISATAVGDGLSFGSASNPSGGCTGFAHTAGGAHGTVQPMTVTRIIGIV